MPEVITATFQSLAGGLAIIETHTAHGQTVRAVVRVAGLDGVTFLPGGLDQAWTVLSAPSCTMAVLDAGGDGRLPLVEPYVQGEPLGTYLRTRHLIMDPGGTYALAPVGAALPVPWAYQFASWVDGGLMICVAIFVVLLIGFRDRQVRAELAQKDPHPKWYKRLFRAVVVSPSLGKPIKIPDALPTPPSERP